MKRGASRRLPSEAMPLPSDRIMPSGLGLEAGFEGLGIKLRSADLAVAGSDDCWMGGAGPWIGAAPAHGRRGPHSPAEPEESERAGPPGSQSMLMTAPSPPLRLACFMMRFRLGSLGLPDWVCSRAAPRSSASMLPPLGDAGWLVSASIPLASLTAPKCSVSPGWASVCVLCVPMSPSALKLLSAVSGVALVCLCLLAKSLSSLLPVLLPKARYGWALKRPTKTAFCALDSAMSRCAGEHPSASKRLKRIFRGHAADAFFMSGVT